MFLRLYDEAAQAGISTGAAAPVAASAGSGTSATQSSSATTGTQPSGGSAVASAGSSAAGAPSPAQQVSSAGSTGFSDGSVPGQQAAAQAQATRDLFARLAEAGGPDLKGKYQSEDDLVRGLANAARLVGQRDEFSQIGRQVQPHWNEFQQWMQTRGQQQQQQQFAPQQQAPADPYASLWEIPPVDEGWQQFRTVDAEGNAVWADNTPLDVRQGFDKWASWNMRFQRGMQRNPDQVLRPYVQKIFDELSEQRFGQYDTMQAARQIGQQTQQWMYIRDSNGDVKRDPITLQPILHPQYPHYQQAMQVLQQNGVSNPIELDRMAKLMAAGYASMQAYQDGSGMGSPNQMSQSSMPQQQQVPPGAMHVAPVANGSGAVGTGVNRQPPEFKGSLSSKIRQAQAWKQANGLA